MANQPKRVLIAEDAEVVREIIITIVEEMGIAYDVVDNGEEALKKLKSKEYDIFLTDLYMPIVGGITAITELRKMDSKNSKIPIIVLSAFGSEDLTTKAFEAGATEYLMKPLDFGKVTKMIEKYMK